ncbi:hypothetical protein GIB67_021714 [Kingdonia uniflora]|uniref:CS domain-containing protein n=1 Tax=Kingdonia uniflora TaxID=39325 RepID=A0A7J7LMI8_9MAGN|nr:hypothetical protein GIB67_021714 [Kingdonia uniflora]
MTGVTTVVVAGGGGCNKIDKSVKFQMRAVVLIWKIIPGQTLEDVTVIFPLPPITDPKCVHINITDNNLKYYLKLGLQNKPPNVEGELYRPAVVDECIVNGAIGFQGSFSVEEPTHDNFTPTGYIVEAVDQFGGERIRWLTKYDRGVETGQNLKAENDVHKIYQCLNGGDDFKHREAYKILAREPR